ncbi:dynamin-like GTPase family protein [Crocosphaera sp. UHCC 0190]|uniref:dynamin-like GTPase family protein n=1 Tax=Crocosphaera sp. UHCC 0190 TaxID=3110246 RepID=UPI002B21E8A5|nr:dynamin-like GTPase family protein [Crocosphaera sp. UHCC 0190]MEA5511224.1 dynamin-like GTPase family protein [Crocosphaera sp. UHCC 0190]
MSQSLPQCEHLSTHVNLLLELLYQEHSLRSQQDVSTIEASLKKAVSPQFEIVFAGAFSAGKSMLINALLERELLYSAEGHATGTECHIYYAEPEQERVVLTFLSEVEIREQIQALCQRLNLQNSTNINQAEVKDFLNECCQQIIEQEGGENKSERAKQAKALMLLLEGFTQNRDRIHTINAATYSMEQFNFSNLTEAASYARRGSNSSVLKRLDYYCHHPLLKDGNVLVDMPGIDAPVKKDADLTYRKIEHPDTSAVVCVLKPASAGDMTTEETELLEKMRANLGIRDRVFYVFNRIDETWYAAQLRQRLDSLIQSQFRDTSRVHKTSGLLGFYGSQIKHTNSSNRFGLDTLFAESVKSMGGEEETPQFVSEFNNYCANSGKLTRTEFKVSVHGYETPNENYIRILSEWGIPLINQLITDSGIEDFRSSITRYLTEEKRPQLFATLADDLQPLCITLRKYYLDHYRDLESQPREIDAMKAQELTRLNHELQEVGLQFKKYIANEVNEIIVNGDNLFEEDFQKLKARMVSRLDELVNTFSVQNAHRNAALSHPRNATVPLIAILVEALYYLANELENVLVEGVKTLTNAFCQRLLDRVKQTEYYRKLYRLLGNDGGIENQLKQVEISLIHALVSEAKVECDRYVRESPRFYDENTFSIYQFRQTLQQVSQGYDCSCMVEAEPAIRQLLKLDFEPKVSATIRKYFRQTINETLKSQLLPMADQQADIILQQYDQAREYLGQTLEQEAQEKIDKNLRLQGEIKEKIEAYNEAVLGINHCLKAMQVYERQLPLIGEENLQLKDYVVKAVTVDNSVSNGNGDSENSEVLNII